MDDVIVYSSGLCYCSVCVKNGTFTKEEIENRVNEINPTGINSKWKLSTNKEFAEGAPNPCPCNQNPKTRSHFLLSC